jgi:hypothetical protein
VSDSRSSRARQVGILRAQLDRHVGATQLVTDVCFDVTERFRFDVALPLLQIGIDVDARSTPEDVVKYNAAAIAGWLVLRFTQDMIVRGQAVHQVLAAMRYRGVVVDLE